MLTETKFQYGSLIVLRLMIGWHFLYEGIVKLYNPGWTAKGYLLSSNSFLQDFFRFLASDELIGIVDTLNMLILVLVGLSLLLGFMDRYFSWAGAMLLVLYYLAHPAWPGLESPAADGNFFIINKNLIEAAALIVLAAFPTSHRFGLAQFFTQKTTEKA